MAQIGINDIGPTSSTYLPDGDSPVTVDFIVSGTPHEPTSKLAIIQELLVGPRFVVGFTTPSEWEKTALYDLINQVEYTSCDSVGDSVIRLHLQAYQFGRLLGKITAEQAPLIENIFYVKRGTYAHIYERGQ